MVRKFLLFCLVFILSTSMFAQVPDAFKYQAVIRNSSGEILPNQDISLRISILDGSATGTNVFTETHSTNTNDLGVIAINIGQGTLVSGDFDTINWSTGDKYLKVEIDENGGNSYTNLGTVELLSIPYALYANDVLNRDDADADTTNEIQDISLAGTDLSITSGSTVDLSVIQDGVDDADADPGNEYQNLSLVGDTLELSSGNKIVLPYDSSKWIIQGNAMYYNDGNVGIGSSDPVSNLEVKAITAGSDALFQVINANNDTVFAVYPDGVKIFVDPTAKGKVGGFAVSGRTSTKGIEEEYLRVTPDSTRIYINEDTTGKGKVGGFAVSGRTSTKGVNNDYLVVTEDSTRVYVKKNTGKGTEGGFAVGEFSDQAKSSTGKFMDITPLNSFIGLDAGRSNTTGERNAFIGYQAGYTNTSGFDNVFIGNESGLNNTTGKRNIFIGTKSGEQHTTGLQNIAIGLQSGRKLETGNKNIFIGTVAGASNIDGDDNVFIGNYAGNKSTSSSNVYIGRTAGQNNTVGTGNVFIGEQAGRSNVEGSGNVFIGKGAGQNELGSNRLYISNSYTTYPLIYGEFDNGLVEVKGSVNLTNILNLRPKTSYPGSPAEGDVFYDKNTHSIKFYNGTEWMELAGVSSSTMPPQVTTDSIPALHILGESCIVYGNISDQGSSAIVESGVCYSEIPFYDFELRYDSVHATPGVGVFNVTMTGLPQYQDIYIRTFATNSEGTSMGNMIMITTPITSSLPSVETGPVVNITQTSATGGGNVTLPGGVALTERGICWSTSPEPTIGDNVIPDVIALGEFETPITGLTENTTYYVRAYATNGNGTAYGEEKVFKTASSITTVSDVEGNVYNTVQIGIQTWMKENLKTTKYDDGSDIPNITDDTEWDLDTDGAFCWYDNDSTTYHETYGVMYNYYTVADSRNLCPSGWHVATDTDWTNLSDYLGGEAIAGGKLKETGTTHWTSDPGVDNSSGFTALPGGWRYTSYGFYYIGTVGQWLSSTENSINSVWTVYLTDDDIKLTRYADYKNNGYSVRCIKD